MRAESTSPRNSAAAAIAGSARRFRNVSGRTTTATAWPWRVRTTSSPPATRSMISGSAARASLTVHVVMRTIVRHVYNYVHQWRMSRGTLMANGRLGTQTRWAFPLVRGAGEEIRTPDLLITRYDGVNAVLTCENAVRGRTE